jgi:hypothetical protein
MLRFSAPIQRLRPFAALLGYAALCVAAMNGNNANAQGVDDKTLFFKEYFSQYPYQAILLPESKSILPGTIVFGDYLTSYLSPDQCFNIDNIKDFAPFVATRTSLQLSSSNWYTTLNVKIDAFFSANADISISREESLQEKGLTIKKQVLGLSVDKLISLVKGNCRAIFLDSITNSSGTSFVIEKLLTFTGELNSMSKYIVGGKAGISIDTSNFVDKARGIPFLSRFADSLAASVGSEVTLGTNNGQSTLERFPTTAEGELYEFLAFVPLFVSPSGLELIKEQHKKDQEEISRVLSGQKDANLFLGDNSLYDNKNSEGLIFRLFSKQDGEDSVRYADYTIRNEDNLISSQISDIYIINALAGRI